MSKTSVRKPRGLRIVHAQPTEPERVNLKITHAPAPPSPVLSHCDMLRFVMKDFASDLERIIIRWDFKAPALDKSVTKVKSVLAEVRRDIDALPPE